MSRGPAAVLAIAAAVAAGCSVKVRRPGAVRVPERAATTGDAILKDVPAGADLLVELDLTRLYENATVGAVARAWLGRPAPSIPGLALPAGDAPLADARAVVLAAYGVGTADAAAATFVVTRHEVPGAVTIADGVVVLAPPPLVARIREVVAGKAPSAAGDRVLLALRARAMPAGATGAVVRATGRLGLDARVALGRVVGEDLAPANLSLWGDVADDLAVVAVLDGHDAAAGGGERLAAALGRVRVALAASVTLLDLGLAPPVRAIRVIRRGDLLEVVATVGPHRLAEAAKRLAARGAADGVAPGAAAAYPQGSP